MTKEGKELARENLRKLEAEMKKPSFFINEIRSQEMKHDKDSDKFDDLATETINLKPASNSSYTINVNEKWIFDTAKLTEEEKEALTKPKPGVIVFDDRLPSGEPCREDEVAGLGWLNLGRYDPMRKTAVFHDRLYDGIIAGTSDITQDEADKLYLKAMLAEADQHQLGYARAIFRYGIVRLVSFFRRVGK